MNDISIKIKIGERIYPMKIKQQDEAHIRKVSKVLNDRIAKYTNKFGIGDKQDLLAMVAFDCLIEKSSTELEQNSNHLNSRLESILSSIDNIIGHHNMMP